MPLSTDAPFDGRAAILIANNTSVNILEIPEDKILKVTHILLSNNNGAATRARQWDGFTDSSGNVHDAVTNPVLLSDFNLQPAESASLEGAAGLTKAIGTPLARATIAAADPDDVVSGMWGYFE